MRTFSPTNSIGLRCYLELYQLLLPNSEFKEKSFEANKPRVEDTPTGRFHITELGNLIFGTVAWDANLSIMINRPC